jgi:hypothetical protein
MKKIAKEIDNFKEFKQEYFDYSEFLIKGDKDKLKSFYDEGVKLHFIREIVDLKFPITIVGNRTIHFELDE